MRTDWSEAVRGYRRLSDLVPAHWQAGQHVHFADSGHFIMFEQFHRFIDVVTRFLQAPHSSVASTPRVL